MSTESEPISTPVAASAERTRRSRRRQQQQQLKPQRAEADRKFVERRDSRRSTTESILTPPELNATKGGGKAFCGPQERMAVVSAGSSRSQRDDDAADP